MASEKLYRNTLWCWMLSVWPLKNCIETPYSVGCCWIKFEFAYPQTFSLRQRAPVFSFPHLYPKPVELEHNKFPCVFVFSSVSSTIYKEKIDGLCTGSVLVSSTCKLACDGPCRKMDETKAFLVSHFRKIISSEFKFPMQHIGQFYV